MGYAQEGHRRGNANIRLKELVNTNILVLCYVDSVISIWRENSCLSEWKTISIYLVEST